jgi:hypothetical protein
MGFATTISQLTQQSGIDAAEARREQAKIAAAALTSNAEAQSHAAAAKGAIWGSAISNIGNSIADIPAQMAKTKALDLQAQDVQAQIDERKAHAAKVQQEDAENQQVDRAFQESLRPDGTVDMQAFSSKIPGSKQQVYLPLIEKVNAAAEADKQKKESVAAHAFFSAYKGGTPASLVTAAKMGVAAKAMTPEDLAQIQQIAGAISSGPVEAQEGSTRTLAAHLGSHFPQFQDLLDSDTGKQVTQAHLLAQTAQANATAAKTEAETAGTLPETAAQKDAKARADETARHNKEMERIDALREGKQAAAEQETARHNKATEANAGAANTLTKVEHKDPTTGKTVIEWLPKGSLAGKTFEKGTGATTENRLASAQAVNQTGDDIIKDLSDPAFASKVGPVMGRASSLRDFIGNPPPEFSEMAGKIESYALANMGVHGMRSAQGAEQIKKLLDQKHTPASLIAAIKGLNAFSAHFLENEGRTVPKPADAAPKSGTVGKYTYTVE